MLDAESKLKFSETQQAICDLEEKLEALGFDRPLSYDMTTTEALQLLKRKVTEFQESYERRQKLIAIGSQVEVKSANRRCGFDGELAKVTRKYIYVKRGRDHKFARTFGKFVPGRAADDYGHEYIHPDDFARIQNCFDEKGKPK